MEAYTFPNNIYDKANNLLSVLGSWWVDDYANRDQVKTLIAGKSQVEKQTIMDLMELINSLSRYTIPIYHKDNWYPLYIKQSELNAEDSTLVTYDSGIAYDGGVNYNDVRNITDYVITIPTGLVHAPLMLNRFVGSTLTWVNGIDYKIAGNLIRFKTNPFTDDRVAKRNIYTNGIKTDTEAILWIFQGDFDWDYIYKQFAYVLNIKLNSSEGYKKLTNAVYDSLVAGTTKRSVTQVMSALTGVPLVANSEETVEVITENNNKLLIITDKEVYKYELTATPLVSVGDTVYKDGCLTDALKVFELNKGVTPDILTSITLGPGMLSSCFYSSVIFENKELPILVDAAHKSGYTKVTWGLGGFALDVEKFFDELHAKGIIAAQKPTDDCDDLDKIKYYAEDCDEPVRYGRLGTIAHLLDTRENKVGEPTAAHLPTTINPLKFLVANILRNNVSIIKIKINTTINSLPFQVTNILRKIINPNTAVFIIFELAPQSDTISGTAGSDEISTFSAAEPTADTINNFVVSGAKTIKTITGSCY